MSSGSNSQTQPAATLPVTPWARADTARGEAKELRELFEKLEKQALSTVTHTDSMRAEHAAMVEDLEAVRRLVEEVEGRVRQVHQLTERYAAVEDPVIANDGYTYERRAILAYLEDCRQSGVPARSHQGDCELNGDLFSNSTLRRLTEQLRAVKLPADTASSVPTPAGSTRPSASATPFQPASARQGQPPPFNAAVHAQRVQGQMTQPSQSQFSGTGSNAQAAAMRPLSGNLHPCVRVYGNCIFGDGCTYARYPVECCLSHLKGRCRYGNNCHELHVVTGPPPPGAAQMATPDQQQNSQF